MSHLPLSLMNSLLFPKFGCCISKGSFYTNYLETTTAVVMPCGGPKSLPVHRYSVDIIFTYSGPLGL